MITDTSNNSLPPNEIVVTIDVHSKPVASRCVAEIKGAVVTADDGREISGDVIGGFGAVASIMERKMRDEFRALARQG
ncbi:hypothetical protein ASG20_10930 [Sphingomonas sp. Leaf198]|nr:hypothetical protein ASG20_10930 [Sphingomonas sp. Leaf198]